MEVLEYDHEIFNAQQAEADKNLMVRFFTMPLKNEAKSVEEGRPIFVDTPMIEIRVRGDRNNIVVRPVRPDDKRRFARAWDDFERGREAKEDGTPLAEWPVMSASMVEEMKHLGFFTVEQLAKADDSACSRVNGLTLMRNKARLFLEFSKDNAPLEKLQSENEQLRSQVEVLTRTNDEMSKRMEELSRKFEALADKVVAKK